MLVWNRKIEKRRSNFPDTSFGVNVQFFLNSKLCLFIVLNFRIWIIIISAMKMSMTDVALPNKLKIEKGDEEFLFEFNGLVYLIQISGNKMA